MKFFRLFSTLDSILSTLKRLVNIELDNNKKLTDLCSMLYDLNKSNLDLNKTNFMLNKNVENLNNNDNVN